MALQIWDTAIVQLGDEEYEVLQADGWEPFWCTLIPVPVEATNPLIVPQTNGAGFSGQFVKMVGMRKKQTRSDSYRDTIEVESGLFDADGYGLDTDQEQHCGHNLLGTDDRYSTKIEHRAQVDVAPVESWEARCKREADGRVLRTVGGDPVCTCDAFNGRHDNGCAVSGINWDGSPMGHTPETYIPPLVSDADHAAFDKELTDHD